MPPNLFYVQSIPLEGTGDCALMGVSADLRIFVEETEEEDPLIVQTEVRVTGEQLNRILLNNQPPLPLPDDLIRPRSAWQTMTLNFAGARHRGLRLDEHLDSLVHPLLMTEKLFICDYFALPLPPPMLLGLIESYSLAEASLDRESMIVCRRLRVAVALPQRKQDTENMPYDYDTLPLYIAHWHQPRERDDLTLDQLIPQLGGAKLNRPMDCLAAYGHLFIADGGTEKQHNQIHIWRYDVPKEDDEDTRDKRRLYG